MCFPSDNELRTTGSLPVSRSVSIATTHCNLLGSATTTSNKPISSSFKADQRVLSRLSIACFLGSDKKMLTTKLLQLLVIN